eukprot:scaffold289246_cov31-Tisochrysis_lutea.AAC.3
MQAHHTALPERTHARTQPARARSADWPSPLRVLPDEATSARRQHLARRKARAGQAEQELRLYGHD